MEGKWHLFWIFDRKYMRHRGAQEKLKLLLFSKHLYLVSLLILTLSSSQYIKALPITMHSPLTPVTPVWPYTGLIICTSIIYAPYFSVLLLFFDSLTLKIETVWLFKLLGNTCAVTQFLYYRFKYSYENTADSCARMWCSVFVWCMISVI